jgi:hypothetical protein
MALRSAVSNNAIRLVKVLTMVNIKMMMIWGMTQHNLVADMNFLEEFAASITRVHRFL